MIDLLKHTLDIIVPMVATVAGSMAVAYLTKLSRKAGLDITQQQQEILRGDVVNAIQSVQEKSNRALTNGTPLSSADKHALATDIVAAKQPDVKLAIISEMIDAVLPEVRAKLEPPVSVTKIATV